jgi:hypothetical protein
VKSAAVARVQRAKSAVNTTSASRTVEASAKRSGNFEVQTEAGGKIGE